jgi:hypothetical protein
MALAVPLLNGRRSQLSKPGDSASLHCLFAPSPRLGGILSEIAMFQQRQVLCKQQFVSLTVTMDGVNDSFGMVGGNILYDCPTNTQIKLDYPGSPSTGAFGINDYIHIVGNWSDSNSVQHGFLATPKQ